MKERTIRVGKPTPLIGVASEPDAFSADRPAVLVLNSGVMHHVGSCRLSVKIARAAAARGLLAVRFDYSGIGDSEPRRGADSFEETATREGIEMMDYLERTRGVKQFILYGLCSGADMAYLTALADARVVGFAQIDAFCYITWRYQLNHYVPKLLDGKRWAGFLRRKLSGGGRDERAPNEIAGIEEEYFEVPTYTRVFPPREQVADGLRKLTDRGVAMYVNFTGGEPAYNYESQYRDSFRDVNFRDLLTLDYYPLTNHIITQPQYQTAVVERIAEWMRELGERRAAGMMREVA
ncbi:MAG: hypothetical protein R3E77_06300 [Steroidobacteraceae bacterium]